MPDAICIKAPDFAQQEKLAKLKISLPRTRYAYLVFGYSERSEDFAVLRDPRSRPSAYGIRLTEFDAFYAEVRKRLHLAWEQEDI